MEAAVRSGWDAYRKLTGRFYKSMRGRHDVESLKAAARAAFEEQAVSTMRRVGDTIILDSAGEDILATPWPRFLEAAKAAGLTTALIVLNAPLSLSLARQVVREAKGDRKVPESQTRAAYAAMVQAVGAVAADPNLDRFVEYRWAPTPPITEADWVRDPLGPPSAREVWHYYPFAGTWRLGQDVRLHLSRRLSRPRQAVRLTAA